MPDDEQKLDNNENDEKLKGQVPEVEKEPVLVFLFNDELGDYEEIELEENIPLYELLDSENILLFIDPEHFRVYIWQGNNTTTRMKFVSAKIAPKIRDRYGIAYKISSPSPSEYRRKKK